MITAYIPFQIKDCERQTVHFKRPFSFKCFYPKAYAIVSHTNTCDFTISYYSKLHNDFNDVASQIRV